MDARFVAFGQIEINGHRFDRDIVVEGSRVRRRKKGPSKAFRDRYGHTPLSADEAIPWSADVLIIGTGAAGQLPVMPEVYEEARRRRVEVIAVPTAEACELLSAADGGLPAAVLHVTC
jgi:hypothetical protein